jgi:hypothetical protein
MKILINIGLTFYVPGFNVETVEYKNVSFTVWDVGGQDKVWNMIIWTKSSSLQIPNNKYDILHYLIYVLGEFIQVSGST